MEKIEWNTKNIGRFTVGASMTLFTISLTQKCYCTSEICGDSIAVFFVGMIGIFYGGATLVWLANPVILVAWILTIKNSKVAIYMSIVALATCVSFLFFDSIIDDEGGNVRKIISYGAGYWLWTASAAALVIGNIYLIMAETKSNKQN
ncbi:MAG: hypothetical protein ACKVOU_01305 [Cytophagales bacterium]